MGSETTEEDMRLRVDGVKARRPCELMLCTRSAWGGEERAGGSHTTREGESALLEPPRTQYSE